MGNTKSTKVVVINETATEIEAKLTIREKVLGEPCLISGKSEDSEHSPEGEIASEYIWYTVMIYDFRRYDVAMCCVWGEEEIWRCG
jgi:hypothetical protein